MHQIPKNGVRAQHLRNAVNIVDDIWIGPLGSLREPLLMASEARGENWEPRRHLHAPYAVWRANPVLRADNGIWWDVDYSLATCIQLLRLARPTTLAYRYACRLRHDAEGQRIIQPGGVVGHQAAAYISGSYQDGVQDEDIDVVRGLWATFDRGKLPNRVKNALWMHEHLAWIRLMNIRWPLVVTALEALVHTDDRKRSGGKVLSSTDQFCVRLAKLQDFAKASLWSSEDLREIYELRSSFAHGRGGEIDTMNGKPLRLYELAEDGLRRILRSTIERSVLADIFRTDVSVRSALG